MTVEQYPRIYKGPKKTQISLTSLLDLLFVMIFVSLLQQKAPSTPIPVKAPKPIAEKKVESKPTPTPAPKPLVKIPVEAEFHFYATDANRNIPEGKYLMQGSYDQKDGSLRLGGVGWLQKPKNYDMVPLSGKIGPSHKTFRGRIEFQSCKEFTLTRTSTSNSSEVSGKWEGSYDCAQGATGLTLTIL